jgi:hypothetical protein
MFQIFNYYSRFNTVRTGLGGLPFWGRWILAIFALPGIVLLGLSILALGVSILALLLLTAPVYRILRWISGGGRMVRPTVEDVTVEDVFGEQEMVEQLSPVDERPAPRRQIDVRIVEYPE